MKAIVTLFSAAESAQFGYKGYYYGEVVAEDLTISEFCLTADYLRENVSEGFGKGSVVEIDFCNIGKCSCYITKFISDPDYSI